MSLKISNNSLFEKHFLTVDSDGLRFYNGAIARGAAVSLQPD